MRIMVTPTTCELISGEREILPFVNIVKHQKFYPQKFGVYEERRSVLLDINMNWTSYKIVEEAFEIVLSVLSSWWGLLGTDDNSAAKSRWKIGQANVAMALPVVAWDMSTIKSAVKQQQHLDISKQVPI